MKRALLCSNPAASGFTGGLQRSVAARLRRHFDVHTILPETAADARAAGSAAGARGFDVVVAMGGDGVVHQLANGIGGASVPMGIIPAGSTNVLARLLGIPRKPLEAVDLICAGPAPRTIPAAVLTLDYGEGRVDSRLATFSFGVGFDAAVVQRAEQKPYRKYSLANLHYAFSATTVAWDEYSGNREPVEVEFEDGSTTAVAVFVAVHDSYTFFGPIPIRFGPEEKSLLTVLTAESLGRSRLPAILWRALTARDMGRATGLAARTGVPALSIAAPPGGILAQADGELLGTPEKLSVAAHPNRLLLIAPQ